MQCPSEKSKRQEEAINDQEAGINENRRDTCDHRHRHHHVRGGLR